MPDSLQSQLLSAALANAARAWPVHPCIAGDKRPMLANWPTQATTDAGTIRRWWAATPDANIGVVTGAPSGVWVLDLDGPAGLADLDKLEAQHGTLPPTRVVCTPSGGGHYYFATPMGVDLRNRAKIGGMAIDVRASGGYVVAPPSRTPKGAYNVATDLPIADAPQWLLDLVTRRETPAPATASLQPSFDATLTGQRVERARAYLASVKPAVQGDGGSNVTLWAARVLVRGFMLDRGTARQLMAEYSARCSPPWSDREIEHKLDDAESKPFDKPAGWLLDAPRPERNGTHTPMKPTAPASGDWPEPIPLHTDPAVPAFPAEVLPDWLREWATAQAEELQVPVDLPSIAGLVVAAAGIARKVVATPWAGWKCEPVNLFGLVALPPGERKSQTFRKAMVPVAALETYLQTCAKPRIAEAESLHRVASKRVEHLESQLAKAAPEDRDEIRQSLNEAIQELERCVVPVLPVLHVSDDTPEKLTSEIIRQNGRLLAASPEAQALGNIVRDRKVNVDVFLMGHAGDDIKTGRIGRGREGIERAALSCLYSPQPCVLENLAYTPELRGRGFLGRWLYSLPKSRVGERDIATAAVPDRIRNRYLDSIHNLWLTEYADPENHAPHELLLSDDAREVLIEFLRWIESELRPDGTLAGLGGWGNKLGGLCARLSAIFHAGDGIDLGTNWMAEPVEADTVRRTVRLCREYAIGHALATFDLMGVSETVIKARKVLAWIKGSGETTFTRRDAYRGTRPTFETADDIQPTLELLERHNLIRTTATEPKTGPGRKPSEKYDVNPAAFASGG